jgi:hypothetical protein
MEGGVGGSFTNGVDTHGGEEQRSQLCGGGLGVARGPLPGGGRRAARRHRGGGGQDLGGVVGEARHWVSAPSGSREGEGKGDNRKRRWQRRRSARVWETEEPEDNRFCEGPFSPHRLG